LPLSVKHRRDRFYDGDGEGDGEGEGEADGDGLGDALGLVLGLGEALCTGAERVAGSGAAGGVAREATSSTPSAMSPATAGTPRRVVPKAGQAPVLWADRL